MFAGFSGLTADRLQFEFSRHDGTDDSHLNVERPLRHCQAFESKIQTDQKFLAPTRLLSAARSVKMIAPLKEKLSSGLATRKRPKSSSICGQNWDQN